jgi:hypothetical protein
VADVLQTIADNVCVLSFFVICCGLGVGIAVSGIHITFRDKDK